MHNSDQLILIVLQFRLRQAQLPAILISLHRLIHLSIIVPLAMAEQMALVCVGQVLLVGLPVDALKEELAEVGGSRARRLTHRGVPLGKPAHVHVVEQGISLHHCLL